uniref:ROK family protein n=1 Tax=Thermofilum pendens TaxID=2269 RepID=A0A7C4FFD9_THEPE
MKYAIAVDIGATNTRVALGSSEGELLEIVVFSTWEARSPEEYIARIARIAMELEKKHGVVAAGVGVGSPGPLDMKRGEVVNAPNMPFKRIEVVRLLREALKRPVAFANDAVTAAVGEKWWGLGRDKENLVYVTISTGIGGGVYVDGELLLGKEGNAHEIGHMVVDVEGRLVCGCGKRGHWEAYSSGRGIPSLARFLADADPALREGTSLPLGSTLTAKDVFDAFRKGDPLARRVVEWVNRFNACGFANIVNAYDPELITVGGSVALNNPDVLIQGLRDRVAEYAVNKVPEITLTKLGPNVGLLGALALGLGLEKKVPLV